MATDLAQSLLRLAHNNRHPKRHMLIAFSTAGDHTTHMRWSSKLTPSAHEHIALTGLASGFINTLEALWDRLHAHLPPGTPPLDASIMLHSVPAESDTHTPMWTISITAMRDSQHTFPSLFFHRDIRALTTIHDLLEAIERNVLEECRTAA